MYSQIVILVLAGAAAAVAECPGFCSGHGTCGARDACSCYENYMGGDCSERVCPFAAAWADVPAGDLNHDGQIAETAGTAVKTQLSNVALPEYFPTSTSQYHLAAEEAHFNVECSGKGICSRKSGQCKCFDGFTGHACQRKTCPNDCSGRGRCLSLKDVAHYGLTKREESARAYQQYFSGTQQDFEYRLWDAQKHMTCVCDPGYFGPDCSKRLCPRGDDPMTISKQYCGGDSCRNHVQKIRFLGSTANANSHTALGVSFQLNFTSHDGGHYVTAPYTVYLGGSTHNAKPVAIGYHLETALEGLPNRAVEDVTVSCAVVSTGVDCSTSTTQATDMEFTIEFIRPTGILPSLVLTMEDVAATAKTVYTTNAYITVQALATGELGNKERMVCSNRGLCNEKTGLCSCFPGYHRGDCSLQAVLSKGSSGY